jgi:hypothetical protein
MADSSADDGPTPHPFIRLVYSRPADLPPLPPRRPLNLAIAIERHLQGDGYTDEQFAVVFARPAAAVDSARAPSPL